MSEGITQRAEINAAFTGLRCTNVVRFAADSWRFEFGGQTTLDVRCPLAPLQDPWRFSLLRA